VIVEPKNAVPFALKECIASCIIRRLLRLEMLSAINLNHELCRVRDKVNDVGPDWRLPAKADAIQAMRTNGVPYGSFGLSHFAAKGARTSAHFGPHLPLRFAGKIVRHDLAKPLAPSLALPRKRGRGPTAFAA
jgi:hypothetical protein